MAQRAEIQDLLPDRDVTITLLSGSEQTVRVRAYRATEYFEVRAIARPVLDALADLSLDASEDTEGLLADADAVFARNSELTRELIGLSLSEPVDWEDVTAQSFRDLFYAVLDANHAFFLELLRERATLLTMALQTMRELVKQDSLPKWSQQASAVRHRKSSRT